MFHIICSRRRNVATHYKKGRPKNLPRYQSKLHENKPPIAAHPAKRRGSRSKAWSFLYLVSITSTVPIMCCAFLRGYITDLTLQRLAAAWTCCDALLSQTACITTLSQLLKRGNY